VVARRTLSATKFQKARLAEAQGTRECGQRESSEGCRNPDHTGLELHSTSCNIRNPHLPCILELKQGAGGVTESWGEDKRVTFFFPLKSVGASWSIK